jgi:hypothetical protein
MRWRMSMIISCNYFLKPMIFKTFLRSSISKNTTILFCIVLLMFICLVSDNVFGQHSTIDIVAMHQLIPQSIDENNLQVKAKNQQAINTANEQANLILLDKLKKVYCDLQNRYNTLGTVINLADIGIYASPMVTRIISNQRQIMALTSADPALLPLGVQTEIEFAEKAKDLAGYVAGLSLSYGDINQMKASDRKLLFDDALEQLSDIQQLSGNLVLTLQNSNLNLLLRSINPFQDYIDRDQSIVQDILSNAKYLKK